MCNGGGRCMGLITKGTIRGVCFINLKLVYNEKFCISPDAEVNAFLGLWFSDSSDNEEEEVPLEKFDVKNNGIIA